MAVGNLLFFFDRNFSNNQVKFIYSEKATKFCKISKLLLSYVVPVKSKVEILQNFVAFSECMNFTPKEAKVQAGLKKFLNLFKFNNVLLFNLLFIVRQFICLKVRVF